MSPTPRQRTRIEQRLRESEARMKLAMDRGGVGAWDWDLATGVIHWSESMGIIYGLELEDFPDTLEGVFAFVHPDDHCAVSTTADGRSQDGGLHDSEYRIVRADGAVRWIYGRGQTVLDAVGKPVGMFGICLDITERRLAGDRERFLSDASRVLASSLDYDTVLGQLAELIVRNLADWCAIDTLDDNLAVSRVVVAHSDPAKRETAQALRDYTPDPERLPDTLRWLEEGGGKLIREVEPDQLTAASVLDPAHYPIVRELGVRSCMIVPLRARGTLLGAITLVSAESGRLFDEADLALAEDLASGAALAVDNARLFGESQRIQEQLRKTNEAKDEFLGLVSHELRTPITTICGGARLLRLRGDALDDESKSGILQDISGEAERLHRIVEDLLILARVELMDDLVWEPILLNRIVEGAVRTFRERNPARGIDCRIQPGLPAVAADSTYVEQVLRNLFSNAEKYSPNGSPIEVVAEAGQGEALLRVMDRGPGVPSDEVETIFDRFFRSSGSKGKAGVGLGLTVCKRLVEAQSGRIWARPRKEGGLEIGFSLPFYKGDS